jgi:ribonuclease H / adenosylcobalamin/alpha-ribazole phosphatase
MMRSSKKNILRLFLVRHGETADNVDMRYLGTRDSALTENGRAQATQLAAALSELPIDLIYSSPLARASATASEIQRTCGVQMKLDPRLAEGSFGSWEGMTRAQVKKLDKENAAQLARWETDASIAPPGGESFESLGRRAISLVEDLQREWTKASVVLVSHVGPIKALIAAGLNLPPVAVSRFFLDPGTISVVDWGKTPLLRLFNSHAHQGWASARWMKG